MKLTFPEPVTEGNFNEMRQAVINGPEKYPGANAIIDENGNVTHLRSVCILPREQLSLIVRF